MFKSILKVFVLLCVCSVVLVGCGGRGMYVVPFKDYKLSHAELGKDKIKNIGIAIQYGSKTSHRNVKFTLLGIDELLINPLTFKPIKRYTETIEFNEFFDIPSYIMTELKSRGYNVKMVEVPGFSIQRGEKVDAFYKNNDIDTLILIHIGAQISRDYYAFIPVGAPKTKVFMVGMLVTHMKDDYYPLWSFFPKLDLISDDYSVYPDSGWNKGPKYPKITLALKQSSDIYKNRMIKDLLEKLDTMGVKK